MDLKKPVTVAIVFVVSALVLSVLACDSRSPEEKIAQTRTEYQVELNGWVIKGQDEAAAIEEAPVEMVGGEAEVEGEPESEAEGMEGEEALEEVQEELPPEPVVATILLNLVVSHDSYDPLSGITVDVNQADQSGSDKALHHCWLDTSEVPRVVPTQVDCVLEDVEVAEDDMFAVQIRHNIPPQEMGDYQEFQQGS